MHKSMGDPWKSMNSRDFIPLPSLRKDALNFKHFLDMREFKTVGLKTGHVHIPQECTSWDISGMAAFAREPTVPALASIRDRNVFSSQC